MCEKHFLIHNIFLKFQHFLQKQFPDFFLGFPIIKPYRWHEKLQKMNTSDSDCSKDKL